MEIHQEIVGEVGKSFMVIPCDTLREDMQRYLIEMSKLELFDKWGYLHALNHESVSFFMQHIGKLSDAKEIVKLFAAAVQSKDIVAISALLDVDGTFSIQNTKLEPLEVGAEPFLQWFNSKLLDTEITSIEYDNCIFCRVGNPVVLFNGGSFPRQVKDSSEKSMTGLMLHIVSCRIREIAFCYSFADRENKYMFECNSEKIDELISNGVSEIDAYFQVFYPHGIRNKEDEISWGHLYRCLVDKK